MTIYNGKFYDNQEKGSLNSAKEILPFIMDILEPQSVIDVGCGVGTWLSVFKELGVNDIVGIDGEWVDKERLYIPQENFSVSDLEDPIQINRKFDLTISLEVAEHLSAEKADNFVKYLVSKSPAILFSAAIPFQGGTNHINEQWPEYWIEIFKKYDYQVIDCIRGTNWWNNNIDFWYIQNIFLFIKKTHPKIEKLKKIERESKQPYSIVHPVLYSKKIENHEMIKRNMERNIEERMLTQRKLYEDKIKDQKDNYQKQLKVQNELIQEIKGSNSWKLTKPLRKLALFIKTLKSH